MQNRQTAENKGGGGEGIEDQLDHNQKLNDCNDKVTSVDTETQMKSVSGLSKRNDSSTRKVDHLAA